MRGNQKEFNIPFGSSSWENNVPAVEDKTTLIDIEINKLRRQSHNQYKKICELERKVRGHQYAIAGLVTWIAAYCIGFLIRNLIC